MERFILKKFPLCLIEKNKVLFTYLVLARTPGMQVAGAKPLPQYWGAGEFYPKSTCFLKEDLRDHNVFTTMANKMSEWNKYKPQQSSALYIASGDTTDWAYGQQKIFAFTFELDPSRSLGAGGFYPGPDVIPSVVQKNWEPFLYLMEYADNPYRSTDLLQAWR